MTITAEGDKAGGSQELLKLRYDSYSSELLSRCKLSKDLEAKDRPGQLTEAYGSDATLLWLYGDEGHVTAEATWLILRFLITRPDGSAVTYTWDDYQLSKIP